MKWKRLWVLAVALYGIGLPGCAAAGRPRLGQAPGQAPTIDGDKLSEIQKELSLYSD